MYPTAAVQPGVTDATGGLFGALLAGGLVIILIYVLAFLIGTYFTYRLIRAAVRDGIIAANRKTGVSIGGGSPAQVNGWPPAQEVGAPPAPVYGASNP